MTTVYLSPIGNDAPFYKGGVQLSGGKLYTYAAGTTTLQTTYSTNPGTVPTENANPIVTNSEGYCASAGNRVPVWLTSSTYKFVLKDSNDVTLWTIDNVSGINNFSTTGSEWIDTASSVVPVYVSATSFTLSGDHTNDAVAERWVKTTNAGGTVYSIVISSSYSSPNTTVNVVNVSGTIDSGLSVAKWGLLRPDHPSVPMDVTYVKATDLASAATTSIWLVNGNYIHLTGVTTITSFGTAPYAGARRRLVIDTGLTLTYNASTLVTPAAVDLTLAAGDMIDVVADSTTKMRVFAQAATFMPSGAIIDFAGSISPLGWVECDGTSYLRTTYPGMYAQIGTTWGSVDSTHFNVPDFRGRARIGRGTGTDVETVTSILAAANAIAVSSNADKWVTGKATVISGITGFGGGVTNTTVYVVRVDATHVSFSSTLANAQNGTVLTLTGTGSLVMTTTFTARTLGVKGGEEGHAMSSTELLSHHHAHGFMVGADFGAGGGGQGSDTTDTGGNAAMNIMQPYGVTMAIIKV